MRDRLLTCLQQPTAAAFAGRATVQDGYTVTLGRAGARFLSAAPRANARGQTADLLLVANEAQDIDPDVWDAVFDPMAASTNATTLFLGTVWSRETLLARQMAFLREEEAARWRQPRLDACPGRRWREHLPAYGERVRARIAQFGAAHPFIRTEYCLEELDGEGGLFPPTRIAAMQGDHPRRHRAAPGGQYALLLDVAGEEESDPGPAAFRDDTRRDSTALTMVEVSRSRDDVDAARASRLPTYRVVDRMAWTGVRHTALHAQLVASGARGLAGQRGGGRCHRGRGGAGLVPGGHAGAAARGTGRSR